MRPVLALLALAAAAVVSSAAFRAAPEPDSRLVTLYRLDPISQSYGFERAEFGHAVQNGRCLNRVSDIEYGNYEQDAFSVGIEGGRVGAIVDLGSSRELAERHGYRETVGGGQGFASIGFQGGGLVVLRDYEEQSLTPLAEARALFERESLRSCASARVHEGHLYVARICDSDGKADDEVVVKLIVVEHVPGTKVTFRWQRLERGQVE